MQSFPVFGSFYLTNPLQLSLFVISLILKKAYARFSLNINNKQYTADVGAYLPLLRMLHDALDFTGTRYGCKMRRPPYITCT